MAALPLLMFLNFDRAFRFTQVPLRPGSSVALVTPFDRQTGNVDVPALKRLLQYHLDAGTSNLCILGTTGEASLLDMNERQLVLQTAVELVKGRMCLLVGTGTINPQSVRAMTQQAIDLGCDASLVVTPYYVKPPQRGLIQHMITAADLGLPVVMYNVPGRTGVNMLDESLAVAAQHPLVAGVKDATGDLSRLSRLQQLVREHNNNGNDNVVEGGFLYYSGDDATSLDYVLQGGDGCISVTANVAAADMATMMEHALAGRSDAAREINNRLALLHQNLFLESNPIPVKWAVQQLGLIDTSQCRPPLDHFDEVTFGKQLREALRQGNLLSE